MSALRDPLPLNRGAALPNRLVKSAMSEAMGTRDHRISSALIALYRRWAQGGTGLLITGNVMIDRRALGEPGNVVIEDDRDLPLLRRWAQAAQDQGSRIWMQINHPGRQSPRGLNVQNHAPSAVPFGPRMRAFFDTPRALDEAHIHDIIQRFATTAALAQEAGFDGVQIHGAHGYLVSQFLSPLTNRRDDDWGGSADNRRRFVREVFAAMRKATGDDFPIGIKLNSADFQRGGFSEEESLAVIRDLAGDGLDMLEISGGTYEAPAMAGLKASTRAREAYFLDFADQVRQHTDIPLLVTGGFRTVRGMQDALASGSLDLIGLGRLLAIEPDAAHRLLQGHDPLERVAPITTGLAPIDKAGVMEVAWYTRQLHRMGNGREPQPRESALKSLALNVLQNAVGMREVRRLRA
ncbi:MAG: NADH:flavin oxidoreductase/NADH oxidase family protein [Oceanococcaceae bacterium]